MLNKNNITMEKQNLEQITGGVAAGCFFLSLFSLSSMTGNVIGMQTSTIVGLIFAGTALVCATAWVYLKRKK
jgi:hypothetical protein